MLRHIFPFCNSKKNGHRGIASVAAFAMLALLAQPTATAQNPCDGVSVPIAEDFDGLGVDANNSLGDTVLPPCWTLRSNIDGAQRAYVSGAQWSSPSASLRMSTTTAGYWAIVMLPELANEDMQQLSVRLKLRAPYSGATLEVGVCNNTNLVGNGFTTVQAITVPTANQWIEYVVPLASYTGNGHRVALRFSGDNQPSSGYSIFIDDFGVESCGIWNLAQVRRNASSIQLRWDEYGTPYVNCEYGPEGFAAGSGTTLAGVSTPLTVSGLDASTAYDFRLYSSCTPVVAGTSHRDITLSTLEGPVNDLSLCEGFETSSTLPDGWRRVVASNGYPQTATNYRHSGNRALFFRASYPNTIPIAVMPMIDTVSINTLTVSFWTYRDEGSTAYVAVGVMEYPEDPSSFVPVDTVTMTAEDTWQRQEVSLAAYNGAGHYIALRAWSPGSSSNYMFVDDLEVAQCHLQNVSITNIASRHVDLRWAPVGDNYHGDSLIVYYGGSNAPDGELTRIAYNVRTDGLPLVGGQHSITLSDLEPDSAYRFAIYAQCDVGTYCSGTTLTVRTLEQDLALPYCVDFEGMATESYPSGWSRPAMHDGRPKVTSNRNHSGSRSLNVHAYGNLNYNHSTVVLPMLDVESLNGLTVSLFSYGTRNGNSYLQIGVMDNPNDESTFSSIEVQQLGYNTWKKHVFTISGYNGTGRYIALRYYHDCNSCNYEAWIDDIVVSDAATTGGSAGTITSHGATFTWQSAGSGYNGAYVEWGPSGFERGTGTRDTLDANTFSLTVDTLQVGAQYDYFITALSSTAQGLCDYTRQSFTTFGQPTAASYCYGFEDVDGGGYPFGWSRPETYDNTPQVYNYSGRAHNGSKSLRLYSYNCYTPYHSRAVMPFLEEEDLTGLTLRFWAFGGSNSSRLVVGMTDSPTSAGAFDTLQVYSISNWSNWQQYSIDLGQYSGVGRHLVFRWVTPSGCNSGELFIDDITINRCTVSNVRAYSETTTSVVIDWTTSGSVDSVEVEYGISGFTPGSGTFAYTTDTVITLTALTASATYDYYVRPYCTNSSIACSETKYQFSTTNQRVGDGWCDDIESNSGNYGMPYHWSRPVRQDSWPESWQHSESQYYTSYRSALEFRAHDGGSNIAVMPASEDPLSELVLSFNMRATYATHPERLSLIVGSMPNPFDTEAFVAIDTLHPTYDYRRYDISLASYTGTNRHIALKYLDPENSYNPTYTDDYVLSRCRPANVKVRNITDHSVNISWDRMGYTDSTIIVYGSADQSFLNGTHLHATGTSTTIAGLSEDTEYWFLLFGACTDTTLECQATRASAHTLAEPMVAPICYDFESNTVGTLPAGWTLSYGTNGSVSHQQNNTHGGTASLGLNVYRQSYNSDYRTTTISLPALQSGTSGDLWLEYRYRISAVGATLQMGLMADPYDTATFIPLTTHTSPVSTWARQLFHLSDQAATISTHPYIAFRTSASSDMDAYIYIDDISLRECAIYTAAAGAPTESSITATYSSSITGGGAWIEYHAVGNAFADFAPGSGQMVQATAGSHTFTGLEEATWYAFHVYPACAEANGPDGCNYITLHAQTLHPGVNVPYCETFDDYSSGSYPSNWRANSDYSDDYPTISSGALRLEAEGTTQSTAIMPRLYVNQACPTADSIFANFWLTFTAGADQAALVVGTTTDPADPDAFVPVDTLRANPEVATVHHTVAIRNYTSATQFVAYRLVATDGASHVAATIDDLCMEKCVASDVTVSNVTQSSVTVTWQSYGVDSLVCEYGPEGFAAGSGTTVVLHGSPATIDGLLDGTDYQFVFASVCGCNTYGATYQPGSGSSGTYGGWGYGGWGWSWCYDSIANHNYRCWHWGYWQGHTWGYTPTVGGPWRQQPVDTIRTQAAYLQVPYCEGFEDYDTVGFPRSWRRIGNNAVSGYPALTEKNHHSGDRSLVFYAQPGYSNYAALAPLEPGTTSDMVITFYAYATNSNAIGANARFEVGVMTDPDNSSTFIPLDTVRLAAVAQWQQHAVDLSAYAGSGQYVAFRFAPYNAAYYFYVDDIYLGTCAISDVSLYSSPNNVTLSWQSWHTPTQVVVEYGPQGYDPANGTALGTLTLTSSPAVLDGISPADNYDLYVSVLCNDTATAECFSTPLTLNPKLYVPYCEDFEDYPSLEWPEGAVPDRWNVLRRNSGRQQYPRVETQYGQQIVAFYPSTGNNDNVVMLPPLPDYDTLEGKWVYARFSTYSNNYIFLDFGYLTDTNNASSFVTMATMSNGSSDVLKEFCVQLHSDNGSTRYFAIRARSTSGERWIRLDRLVLSNYPYPTNITATALGVARRRISWQGQNGNAHYTIQYGYGDQWQTVESDSCTAILTGLQPGKDYEVYFISPDGEQLCLPYRFATDEYLPLPYCENFDGYASGTNHAPDGWYCYNTNYNDSRYPYIRNYGNYSHSCCQSLYFDYHNSYTYYAALPDIDIADIRDAFISLYMRTNYESTTRIVVGVMDNRYDMSTFTPVDTLACTAYNTYQLQTISLANYTGTGRYIAFRAMATTNGWRDIFIDDLTITSCAVPTFTVAGARQVKASLPAGSTADYYVEYGTAPFTQGQQDTIWNSDSTDYTLASHGNVLHITESPYYITGLEPGTQYYFYARCGEQDSTCASPAILTTAAEVAMPYCENFDYINNSAHVPQWTYYNTNYGNPTSHSGQPYIYYNYSTSPSKSLELYSHRDHRCYAILPDAAADEVQDVVMYFNLLTYSYQTTGVIVGVMDSPTDVSTFVPVDTFYTSDNYSWESKQVSFSGYTGNGRFIAIREYNMDGYWRYLCIDDVRLDVVPKPAYDLANANTVRIVRGDSRDLWVEMAQKDSVQGAASNRWFHITADTTLIANLDYNTTYDLYHHADSGTITCFPTTRITTSSVIALPYCDNFDSYSNGSMPTGWRRHSSNSNSSEYPQKNPNGQIAFYHSCWNYGSRSYAALPELDIDSLRHAELYFDLYSDRTDHLMVIGVMTNPNDVGTFEPVDTVQGTTTWQARHVSMSRYHGDGRFLAFCFVNNYGSCSSMYIDNLNIQSCPKTKLELISATTVRATIDTNRAADYWIEYGPQGMTPGEVDTLWSTDGSSYTLVPANQMLHVTTDTALITGLDPLTTYAFYARCDSAYTSSCNPLTATITTSTTIGAPMCEGFDTYGTGESAFPPTWRRYNTDNSYTNSYPSVNAYAGSIPSLRFYSYNGSAYAALPQVEGDLRDVSLRLWMLSDNHNYMFLEVGVMTDLTDIGSFHPIDTLRNTVSSQLEIFSTSLAEWTDSIGFIALRMTNNWSWESIYVARLEVLSCYMPADLSVSLWSDDGVRIGQPRRDPDETPTGTRPGPLPGGFYVEYGTAGFEQGTGQTVYVDQLPLIIEELEHSTTYDFYFKCSQDEATCIDKETITTPNAPVAMPYCEDFEDEEGEALASWRLLGLDNYNTTLGTTTSEHYTGTSSFKMETYYYQSAYAVMPYAEADSLQQISVALWLKGSTATQLQVGVMSDPDDESTFMPMRTLQPTDSWKHHVICLGSAPSDARFVALRMVNNGYYNNSLYIDDLHMATCGAAEMRVRSVESDYVVFEWEQTGQPQVSIEYGPTGFARGTGTIAIATGQPPYTLTGLDRLTNYTFYFDATCSNGDEPCSANLHDSTTVFTPTGGTGCIDPTNLTAEYTTCFYGPYGNPYQYTGVIDEGGASAESRHTVHYDLSEYDPRTAGGLRTVPEGSAASVRLGNWSAGAEAEAVAYSLAIDTANFDLLILKYAAVLKDMAHPSTSQPRFKLELLDEEGALIDAGCAAADFIADQALGWNVVDEGTEFTLWKDWTTVGIDLGAYHGRTVTVRLTTFDCADGDHYGYAYFTLQCAQKSLVSDTCGEVEENSFSAPAGFAYNWYTNIDPTTTFSTEQTITVPTDNDITYYCRCSFVDKEDCYFTLSAFAGTRYPLAAMEWSQQVRDCRIEVALRNTSTISADGLTPIGTGEPCESATWIIDGKDTITTYHASATFTTPGQHSVRLVSGLAHGACEDVLDTTIVVSWNGTKPTITGPDEGCEDDAVVLEVADAASQRWAIGGTTPSVSITLDEATIYVCYAVDSNGCTDTLLHTITVHPKYDTVVDTTIYERNFPIVLCGQTVPRPAANDTTVVSALQSTYGCDSVVTHTIHLVTDVEVELYDTVCEDELPYSWNDSLFSASGTKQTVLPTAAGADSTITMHLQVIPTTYNTILDTVVENQLPYQFLHHTYTTDTEGDTLMIANQGGCDSVITYSLFVHRNVDTTVDSTVCEGGLPVVWNDSTFATAGDKSTVLLTTNGADSTVNMRLHVIPTTYSTVSDTVVENLLPHSFLHHSYATDTVGDTLMIANQAGCDSVITYNLYVHRNVDTTVDSTVCERELPITWNDSLFDSEGSKQFTLLNRYGADSTVTMQLHVIATTYRTIFDTIVENELPHTFMHHTYSTDTVGDTLMTVNAGGCDSVITYNLFVHRNVAATAEKTICDNLLPYQWNHRTFAVADTLMDTLVAHTGADSVLTMILHVNPTYTATDTDRICQSALPYTWRDTALLASTSTGIYTRNYLSELGCDSVHHLSLTVDSVYDIHDTVGLCYNQVPYTWRDSVIADSTAAQLYTRHRVSAAGCDSTMTLHLSVHPTYLQHDTLVLCDNAFPRPWRDTTLKAGTTTGDYAIHRPTAYGCDSTMTLKLTVNPTSLTLDPQEHCDTYKWQDSITYTESTNTPEVHFTNHYGCDSTVRLQLTVHHSVAVIDHVVYCEPYLWIDSLVHQPGDSAQVHLQTAHGCDSLVTLDFRMPSPTETHLVDSFCSGTTYLFGAHELTTGGNYIDSLLTTDNCDSIVFLDLTCLAIPTVNIVADADCERAIYHISAEVDVDYFEWTVVGGDWPTSWGSQHQNSLSINPPQACVLNLYADYFADPTCPNTAEVQLYHLVKPHAEMHASPWLVTPENPTVSLTARSQWATTNTWYVDGSFLAQADEATYDVPYDADSVVISLVSSNEMCSDTVSQTILAENYAITVPNVFTPTEETNNRFYIAMHDILEYEIHIYNRYGSLVFTTTDMQTYWDGKDTHGNACPGGAYVYYIRYRNTTRPAQWHEKSGTVLLVR